MVPGWMQILLVVLLIVLLFGRGKISEFMGDLAKGINSFKTGLAGDEKDDGRTIEHTADETVSTANTTANTAPADESKQS
ncbi:MAG: twin-arginine translocase TatA/TatE family subunit [Rhizobiales bacterium]|nr:twin-arginine translocase TatA/TatE family subunit [Hyphomicrobiales bacterium]MBO6698400.1 twin-arginine translocase TatA/TatE family subunit [Hyphomicrobiales bacterium]MBO6735346.1 twin-arginine translocase TatA/TatE family subunit [Hyphomicrobiales bacterium]MBO6910846.1 twin-arginine translocase TatA/TatE family subunit [Hyphomicrobiales bacterium]MBO6955902.1 twin-arginine translocase TatA/TatE family subunit [Hyphomicrobiales bacterium]